MFAAIAILIVVFVFFDRRLPLPVANDDLCYRATWTRASLLRFARHAVPFARVRVDDDHLGVLYVEIRVPLIRWPRWSRHRRDFWSRIHERMPEGVLLSIDDRLVLW